MSYHQLSPSRHSLNCSHIVAVSYYGFSEKLKLNNVELG